MNLIILSYSLYLLLAIPLTIWVAQTLHKNGAPFLRACFHDDIEIAHSVNHLLRVGFYLVNLGFVALWLQQDLPIRNGRELFESLAGKLGIVLLVLGAMHFANLAIFQRLRRHARRREQPALPPIPSYGAVSAAAARPPLSVPPSQHPAPAPHPHQPDPGQ